MSSPDRDDPFYIGYLPTAPAALGRFVRRVVAAIVVGCLTIAVGSAVALPYFGAGEFHFGQLREFSGVMRCGVAPRLESAGVDYLLVGYGKRGAAAELCGADRRDVTVEGMLIQRDGRQLVEVSALRALGASERAGAPAVPLGRFTLRGEIVDSKCYFGVMNPGEGRAHRACAELCLRGGVPAVFVVRDRAGAVAHLLIAGRDGTSPNRHLLPWVAAPVEVSGEVSRLGRWLVLQPDLTSLRLAGR